MQATRTSIYLILSQQRKGNCSQHLAMLQHFYIDTSGQVMLNGQRCPTTVRSAECQVLTSALKCPQCVSYRNTMRAMYHRWQKRKSSSPIHSTSTHTNDRWLTTPERKIKTSLLKARVRSAESTVKYLKDKINASTRKL